VKRLLFLFIIIFALNANAQDLNKIIAKVNNVAITLRDLNQYCALFGEASKAEDFREKSLKHLVEEKLILHLAKKDKIEAPTDWVEGKINKLISEYGSYETFQESLNSQGLTTNKLKEKIKKDFIMRTVVDHYVNSHIKIFPKEITDYYNQNQDQFKAASKYSCWIVKSNKKSFLEKLGKEIYEKGIEIMLKEYEDIFFKIESEEDGLQSEVREAVKEIKAGEFAITEIEDASYLVYLKNVLPPHTKFIEEVKGPIHSILWKQKFDQRFKEWMDQLKKDALIKYYD